MFSLIARQARVLGLGLLLSVGTGCATTQMDYVTGKPTRNWYTLEEDVVLGQNVAQDAVKEMESSGVPINQDAAMVKKLNGMMNRIAAVSHLPDLPYELTLFQTNIVNAAAAPGGQLLFFEGLYDRKMGLARNDNELAAVMAHEIAHVTCRHSTKAITREMPLNVLLLVGALAAELSENDDAALALGAAFVVYQGLWLPRYSRTDEYEADRVGLMYMAKAGYDPRAAPQVWRRIHEKEGSPSLTKYLSSHPTHKERYKELERLMPEAMALYAEAIGGYPSDYIPPIR